jgi:glycosyltransferase involved in cell wall biosynthesis
MATIFHGTMCVKKNQTIYHSEQRRDANTIRVGRFMMERARFEGGMNIDEYSVMSCSSHMDEVWVPTQWHKEAFIETFNSVFGRGTAMNVAVAVIPEAVDTELFDPDKIRPPGHDNPFSVRSREPDDLCWLDDDSRVVCPSISSSWQNRFEFLSVFKWEYRKGWDLLLEAYWRAFDKDDAVVLRLRTYVFCSTGLPSFLVVCDVSVSLYSIYYCLSALSDTACHESNHHSLPPSINHQSTQCSHYYLLSYRYGPPWEVEKNKDINYHVETFAQQTFGCSASELAPVVWEYGKNASLLSESLTRSDMRDLLGSADCFVLPTRGEGWGLPIAEAMAMRLPTIVSNSPGPRAYATAQNAYLIPAENDDNDATDSKGFFKPDKVALQSLLRQVVHDSGPHGQGRARVITAQARMDMAYLSPVKVAGMMAERLRMEADRRGWQF